MPIMVENINAQTITPANGRNPRQLYEHQEEAVKKLDAMDKKGEFRTLLVLPTGGGKTLTAAHWLLRNAVDKGKKTPARLASPAVPLRSTAPVTYNRLSVRLVFFWSKQQRLLHAMHIRTIW